MQRKPQYSLFLLQVMKTFLSSADAAQIMLCRRARQAEERYLWERGMQRETLITSEVLSVLSFGPLIVYLTSIPALAFIAARTTSRYVVREEWLWSFLIHLLRWACTVHCLWWREKSGTSLLSALANMSWVFLRVHEVPAHRGFQSDRGWRTVLSGWMSAPRTSPSRMSGWSVLSKEEGSMRCSSFCPLCAWWKEERGAQVLYRDIEVEGHEHWFSTNLCKPYDIGTFINLSGSTHSRTH